jgi:hypothetical protein
VFKFARVIFAMFRVSKVICTVLKVARVIRDVFGQGSRVIWPQFRVDDVSP